MAAPLLWLTLSAAAIAAPAAAPERQLPGPGFDAGRGAPPADIPVEPPEVAASIAASMATAGRYSAEAVSVVRGEVLTTREGLNTQGRAEVLTLLVREPLRGALHAGDVLEIPISFADAVSSDGPRTYRGVRGYDVIAFLDDQGAIVDGEALYVVEGGFGWRARAPGVMMRPRLDRDWVHEIDPTGDYEVVPLSWVREAVAAAPAPELNRKRRRRS